MEISLMLMSSVPAAQQNRSALQKLRDGVVTEELQKHVRGDAGSGGCLDSIFSWLPAGAGFGIVIFSSHWAWWLNARRRIAVGQFENAIQK